MSVPAHRANLVGFFNELIHIHHGAFDSLLDLCCGELCGVFRNQWGTRYEGLDNRDSVKADYVGDACDLSRFTSNSRNVVTCWSGVEHVTHPYTLLKESCRVSNGVVLLTTDYNQHDKDGDDTHLYSWTPKTFRQLLKAVNPDCSVYEARGILVGVLKNCGKHL